MTTNREQELAAIARKALNGESLTEAEFALLRQVESEATRIFPERLPTHPVIPPLDPNRVPMDPNPVVATCGACGLDLRRVMHYVCPRSDCPCFPKVIC